MFVYCSIVSCGVMWKPFSRRLLSHGFAGISVFASVLFASNPVQVSHLEARPTFLWFVLGPELVRHFCWSWQCWVRPSMYSCSCSASAVSAETEPKSDSSTDIATIPTSLDVLCSEISILNNEHAGKIWFRSQLSLLSRAYEASTCGAEKADIARKVLSRIWLLKGRSISSPKQRQRWMEWDWMYGRNTRDSKGISAPKGRKLSRS